MAFFKKILVTGGAGFIGSNFVHLIHRKHANTQITVLDSLTYAGNLENLAGVLEDDLVNFVKGSITDEKVVRETMQGCDAVFNFAAETHVDRSIHEAASFIQTDVLGTYIMLTVAHDLGIERFIQISTDEVYGSSDGENFTETSPLKPGNPYSASKCGGDLMCHAFHNTFNVPVIVTRSSNNFGPYQHVEKFIPLFITNTIEGHQLPLYGDGMHERDWIYVEDNCEGVETVAMKGEPGQVYNIAVGQSQPNLHVAKRILDGLEAPEDRIVFIEDRKGHDRAYAMDASRTTALGWSPKYEFTDALDKTIAWYRDNESWWRNVKSGDFRKYYESHYKEKLNKGKAYGA